MAIVTDRYQSDKSGPVRTHTHTRNRQYRFSDSSASWATRWHNKDNQVPISQSKHSCSNNIIHAMPAVITYALCSQKKRASKASRKMQASHTVLTCMSKNSVRVTQSYYSVCCTRAKRLKVGDRVEYFTDLCIPCYCKLLLPRLMRCHSERTFTTPLTTRLL